MKHLFTLNEWSKDKWVSFATFATFASAIFCKLVKLVNLVMQFLKLTKLTKLTEQIFAESLKSLMPIFAGKESDESTVMVVKAPTNLQLISNLYLTPNRFFTRFAAVFALVFVLGVGNVWGETAKLIWSSGTNSGTNYYFQAASGSITNIVTFSTANNSSQNAPAYNSNNSQLRMYYASNGSGGSITLTPATGITITGFNIASATNPTTKYKVGSGSATAISYNDASPKVASVTGISATSSAALTIQNCNTSNTQLQIKYIEITYTTSGGGSQQPSLSLNPTSVSVRATDVAQQTIGLTASNFSSAVTTVTTGLYSNAGCTTPVTSGAWVKDITPNNAKTQVTFNVDDNDDAARDIWLKITASNGTQSADAILPISQAKYEAPATLPFSFTSGSSAIANTDGMEQSGLGTDYGSGNPPLKFDNTGDYVIIRFNSAPKALTYDIKGNSLSGSYTFDVQQSADGETYTSVVSLTSIASSTTAKEHSLASTSRYVKFIYTSKSSGNVGLGNIGISKLPTTATLTYDLNGKTLSSGTKPSDASNVTLNQAYTLPTSTLSATGYTFVGWNNDKDANSKLTTFTPTAATTYTMYAIWTPNTNTAYTVKHYKQNLDGTYPSSPTETDNLTGTTDASVTPERKSYTGFTAPSGQTVTILADGSRIVTYNYTRNSYTLTWSTDGDDLTGSYTKGSTKFGAAITAPNTPTKTGYEFDAWSSTPAATMPASNTTYTATWTCKVPEIGTDLSTAQVDYIEDAAATALSISASANGASLSYAWEQSANGTSGWSSVGTNSSSYTPSTAEEGDLYYRCTVTNAVAAGCSSATATSKVAHIHVVAASVCLTPSFSPATGTHVGSQNVTISSTDGATIYYTTDGSDPKVSGTRSTYSSAIAVSVNTTIRAYAEKAEMTASAEGSAAFTIKCADPTFSPAGGSYTSAQSVSLASDYGTVYYTTDGSDPATYGTAYSTPIAVSTTNTTIKAIAKKANCANSDMETASYTISCATPTFSPAAGNIISGQAITLNCATEGATMYYTMGADPATPTTASAQYDPENKPVVSSATTIKVIAVKDGWSNSAVASADYAVKYTVTLNAGTGSISADGWSAAGEGIWTKAQASVGGSITLPNATLSSTLTEAGWSFSGWKTTSAVTTQTDVKPSYVATSYTPTSDITLYAVYQKTTGPANYELVEEDLDDAWAGDYLIAYSSTKFADGSTGGTDGIGANGASVNPGENLSGKVVAASWGDTYKVSLEEISSGSNTYLLKTQDNKYNYRTTNDNGIDLTATRATAAGYPLTVTFNTSSNIGIANSEGAVFHYNTGSSGYFRFYKNGGQSAVYLYKKGEGAKSYYSNPSDKVTLTYHANGATDGEAPAAVSNITIGSNQAVAAKPNDLAKTGYDFGGWNTQADGKGTNYTAGTGEITMTDNITLYAKWTKHNYTVAVASVDHTTITATPEGSSAIAESANASVAYGTEVTLAKTDDSHFTAEWDVYETGNSSNKVIVSEGKFNVPAFNVTVSATYTEDAYRMVKYYSNGGDPISSEKVYVDEAPANAPTPVYEDCLEGSNRFYGWTTAEWVGAINASTLAGKTVYTGALPDVAAGSGDVEYFAVWAKATGSLSPLFSWAGGTSSELTALANVSASGLGSDYAEGNAPYRVKFDTEGDYIVITTSAAIGSVAVDVKMLGGSDASDIYVQEAEDTESEFSAVETLAISGAQNTVLNLATTNAFDADSRAVKLLFHKGSNVGVGPIAINGVVVYSEFRTNCCALKPVTNVTVDGVTASSLTLTWTAPSSTTGITKLQIVNADNGNVLTDNISASATSGTVSSGLTECESINLKVVSFGSECSSNSAVIAAIPQADAKTVTFDYNGGTGSPSSATTPCGETSVDLPSTPTRDGYRFKGWNDGSQTLAVNATTYTPAANVTLTAQWAQLYTVQYNFDGATYGEEPDDAQYEAGETVTLTNVVPNKGILAPFKAWSYSTAVTVTDGTFPMPANNLTITATYSEIVGQWILVTDESQLMANSYVIIAAAGSGKAMKTTQNGTSYRYVTDITKSGSVIENPSNDVQIFVLKAGTVDNSWAFQSLNGDYKDKYIYANSSSSNYMNSQATNDANSSWKLDFENGYATAQGDNTRNVLSFNSDRFACYGNTNQDAIAFYQFREGTFYAVNMPAVAPTGGTVKANTTMAKAGDVVTLTYTPSRGYTVKTLTVTGATSGNIAISPALEAGVTSYTFTMPAEAVTVAASFEVVPPVEYSLVENASDIAMGMQFVMLGTKVDGTEPYVIGEMNNSNRLAGDAVEASAIDAVNKTLSLTTEAAVDFTMDGETGAFKIKYNNQYLEAGSGNTVRWSNTGDAWTIAISEGKATITSGDNMLNYNPSQHWVAAYTTAQQPVALYALPYTTYNFELSDCKTIKVATGYTYTYTIKNSDVPSVTPEDYEFVHKWTDGTNTYAVGDEVVVSSAMTLQPCWKVTPTEDEIDIDGLPEGVTEIVVTDGKNLNVNDNKTMDNLIVEAGGQVSGGSTLTVNNLTIKTTLGTISGDDNDGGKSGEISNNRITATGDVFIEIELTQEAAASEGWYAFSVPFPVNTMNGVYYQNTPLQNEVGYAIMAYHEDERAAGKYAWKKYRETNLVPGMLYIITVGDTDYKTLRFKKAQGKDLIASTSVPVSYTAAIGDGASGWNGVGNPNLQVSHQNDFTYLQFLDHDDNCFRARTAATTDLLVGTAFMVQVASSGDITIATGANSGEGNIALAPARAPKAMENSIFEVKLRNTATGKTEDNLFLTAREDAMNAYEIGRDVTKMSMGTAKCAQMYVPAYGTQLCAADFPLVNGQAEYPLAITAPAAGSYRIETPTIREDASLYLTKDGNIIWDLTMSPYEAEFGKGATEGYALMLVRKAPQVTTGVENVQGDKTQCTKVILNDHVYILRDAQLYDVTGKAVK